jgi:hypothetical protein
MSDESKPDPANAPEAAPSSDSDRAAARPSSPSQPAARDAAARSTHPEFSAASPVTASPVTTSPVTASPVTASPVTASPVTASPVTASPAAGSAASGTTADTDEMQRHALSAAEADAHARRIRPSWELPAFHALRSRNPPSPFTASSAASTDSAHLGRIAIDRALPAKEADGFAERIRPSWEPRAPAPALALEFERSPNDFESSVPDFESSVPDFESASASLDDERQSRARRPWDPTRRQLWWLGAVVAALLVVALGWMSQRAWRAAPATTQTHASALRQATKGPLNPTRERAASTEPGLRDTVRIRIAAEPAHARIKLDGKRVQNPYDARKPKGGRHRVLIEAKGRVPRDLTLDYQRDENIRVKLQTLPTARGGPAR